MIARLFIPLLFLMPLGCSQFVDYAQEISDENTGRTPLVRWPATLGGSTGFVLGIPADAVLLPVTYSVYLIDKENDPLRADAISTILFPSFACWQLGKMVAVPFDILEFLGYRAWRSPDSLTDAQREARHERPQDATVLPTYPVEVLYPAR